MERRTGLGGMDKDQFKVRKRCPTSSAEALANCYHGQWGAQNPERRTLLHYHDHQFHSLPPYEDKRIGESLLEFIKGIKHNSHFLSYVLSRPKDLCRCRDKE